MFSNRTVQIEESEESVRLRSFGTHSASHHQLVACKRLRSVVSISNFSKNSFNLFFLRLSSDYHASEESSSKRRERPSTSAVTGIHAARRDDARRRKPRRFRQDFGIPDEIELVLRLRERTRSMFVRGFAAPIRRIGGAPG
ncbi:unnamed protein product [Microthlaspi erraticum]|uniref:Uncharacterized protein n=1 Tax=Microthlaspi erraticum TaxID=1685480 RepID=A0A6D2LCA6_9BRAS|nr:unnamed protein product [Microthlaspi erraticum]